MNSSLEWIEQHDKDFTSLEEVTAYLIELGNRFYKESEQVIDKEKWSLRGEASGIGFALNAIQRLKR